MHPYLQLIRPANCLITALAVLIGYWASLGAFAFPAEAFALALAAFLVCAGGQSINDYFDRKIDAKKDPQKPIPSGRAKPQSVLAYSAALMVAGVAISALVNASAFAIAAAMALLFFAYSAWLGKYKFLGNYAVALGTAMPFLFGATPTGSYAVPLWFFGAAFCANVARELVKDAEDLKADAGQKRTLPSLLGIKKTRFAVLFFFFLSAIIGLEAFFLGVIPKPLYLLFTCISIIFFASSASAFNRERFAASQKRAKLAMVFALIAFVGAVL